MASTKTETFIKKMRNQVTFGHFLSILTGILLPFAVWMANIHSEAQKIVVNEQSIIKNEQRIEAIKKEVREEVKAREKVEKDILILNTKILEKLHVIELKVENKQNRK